MFNPIHFGAETLYTFIVVYFCFLVYHKTKEMYVLTKYQGIMYFRNAFVFFGLAYASRFLFYMFQLSLIAFDYPIPRRMMFPAVFVLTGYFSTIAIFYLAYSTSWKKMEYRKFLVVSNVLAALVAIISAVTRSPQMVSVIQLVLMIATLVLSKKGHDKRKSHTFKLYMLISLFWLASLFALEPSHEIHPGFRIILQIFSIGVFATILHKVSKWTK